MSVPNGYSLVFEDDFDGETLDMSKWAYRGNGRRRVGYNSPEQVFLKDGCLHMKQEYKNGEYGEGWYGGMIRANDYFLRGYFEIRCICSRSVHSCDGSFWSAFWLQAPSPYDPEKSRGGIGPGGSEIDIIECFSTKDGAYPLITSTIHCSGMKGSVAAQGGLDSSTVSRRILPDACEMFHTYALDWDENEYKFYIDDELVAVSIWGDGVSRVPQELIVSLELPGNCVEDKDYTTEFVVDYVRVWQKK
jgi:beta-glucanase (GH16 family)